MIYHLLGQLASLLLFFSEKKERLFPPSTCYCFGFFDRVMALPISENIEQSR
jgi:hypothetical protein